MFSFIIPTKNRQQLLKKSITHIQLSLKEMKFPYEILIFDDNSTPALKFDDLPNNVILTRSDKAAGPAFARNRLIKMAATTTKYYVFLDDDIFVFNLQEALLIAKKNLDEGYGAVTIPHIDLPLKRNAFAQKFRYFFDKRKHSNDVVFFSEGVCIMKKEVFDACGYFDETYVFELDEGDFSLRMFVKGIKQKVLFNYRIIAIHDRPLAFHISEDSQYHMAKEEWLRRKVLLLSNRLLFHYKFIKNKPLRLTLNIVYFLIYCTKLKNITLVRNAIKRYKKLKLKIKTEQYSLKVIFRFLFKRYFNW